MGAQSQNELQRIDPSHKSYNALDKYPTMHYFVTEMCTFLLQNGALWDMGMVHCGICATGLLITWLGTWIVAGASLLLQWFVNLMGVLTFLLFFFLIIFFLK